MGWSVGLKCIFVVISTSFFSVKAFLVRRIYKMLEGKSTMLILKIKKEDNAI